MLLSRKYTTLSFFCLNAEAYFIKNATSTTKSLLTSKEPSCPGPGSSNSPLFSPHTSRAHSHEYAINCKPYSIFSISYTSLSLSLTSFKFTSSSSPTLQSFNPARTLNPLIQPQFPHAHALVLFTSNKFQSVVIIRPA